LIAVPSSLVLPTTTPGFTPHPPSDIDQLFVQWFRPGAPCPKEPT